MKELTRMLETLNHLCDVLNARGGVQYNVIDWVFGFIVFENDVKVCDGNFANVVQYLAGKL
jgi:hypothetical protein